MESDVTEYGVGKVARGRKERSLGFWLEQLRFILAVPTEMCKIRRRTS